MNYKVKQEDLKGDIKDFPIEVVQKMVDEQVRQGNKADVKVFQKANWTGSYIGGFSWTNSIDEFGFWINVINGRKFDLFFSKYPKQSDLKEDNPKTDKVVVKEKKSAKRTFRKLSEVKLLVTNRNRKAVIAFLDEVCRNEDKARENKESHVNLMDCWLSFEGDCINSWRCANINQFSLIPDEKQTVKLRDIKRIYAREENRKQRELEKTKLFCETAEENVSHAESEVNKVQKNTFLTNEDTESIKEFVENFTNNYMNCHNNAMKTALNKEIKTNEELRKMIDGKIEVLGKIEAQLISLSVINSDLNIANEKLRDYNDVLENKVSKERLFRNIFIFMFIISFITLVAISLKY